MIHPGPSAATAPFWDTAREHRLALPRCTTCGRWLHPQAAGCACGGDEVEWTTASGRASLVSYAVVRRAMHPAFSDEIPYTLTLVALEEGPQLVNGLAGDDHDLHVGAALDVWFDDIDDEVTLPRFAPRRTTDEER